MSFKSPAVTRKKKDTKPPPLKSPSRKVKKKLANPQHSKPLRLAGEGAEKPTLKTQAGRGEGDRTGESSFKMKQLDDHKKFF